MILNTHKKENQEWNEKSHTCALDVCPYLFSSSMDATILRSVLIFLAQFESSSHVLRVNDTILLIRETLIKMPFIPIIDVIMITEASIMSYHTITFRIGSKS